MKDVSVQGDRLQISFYWGDSLHIAAQDFSKYNGFPVSRIDPVLLPPVLGGIGGLLVEADGTPLQEAKCTVEGEMLVIQSDAISRAGRIRICFAETAFHQVNLFNAAGIPALPFERVLVRN